MKRLQISLHDDQADFLNEMANISRMSKSEIIRQCLDKLQPELTEALHAMKKGFFRPATKAERKKAMKK